MASHKERMNHFTIIGGDTWLSAKFFIIRYKTIC